MSFDFPLPFRILSGLLEMIQFSELLTNNFVLADTSL
jgi:hypothetical protein